MGITHGIARRGGRRLGRLLSGRRVELPAILTVLRDHRGAEHTARRIDKYVKSLKSALNHCCFAYLDTLGDHLARLDPQNGTERNSAMLAVSSCHAPEQPTSHSMAVLAA